MNNPTSPTARAGGRHSWLEIVESQVQALKHGSVAITVRDGRVIEVETCVSVRLDTSSSRKPKN